MKKSIFLLMLTVTAMFSANAQGLTGTIPKPAVTIKAPVVFQPGTQRFGSRLSLAMDTATADTSSKSVLVARPDIWAGYGYTSNGLSHGVVGTGVSIGGFNWKGERWVPSWAVGLYAFANSTTTPPKSFNEVVSVGITGSYFIAGSLFITGGYARTLDGHGEVLAGVKLNIFPAN